MEWRTRLSDPFISVSFPIQRSIHPELEYKEILLARNGPEVGFLVNDCVNIDGFPNGGVKDPEGEEVSQICIQIQDRSD